MAEGPVIFLPGFGSAEYAPGYGQDEARLGPNENDKESGDGDKEKKKCSRSNLLQLIFIQLKVETAVYFQFYIIIVIRRKMKPTRTIKRTRKKLLRKLDREPGTWNPQHLSYRLYSSYSRIIKQPTVDFFTL